MWDVLNVMLCMSSLHTNWIHRLLTIDAPRVDRPHLAYRGPPTPQWIHIGFNSSVSQVLSINDTTRIYFTRRFDSFETSTEWMFLIHEMSGYIPAMRKLNWNAIQMLPTKPIYSVSEHRYTTKANYMWTSVGWLLVRWEVTMKAKIIDG